MGYWSQGWASLASPPLSAEPRHSLASTFAPALQPALSLWLIGKGVPAPPNSSNIPIGPLSVSPTVSSPSVSSPLGLLLLSPPFCLPLVAGSVWFCSMIPVVAGSNHWSPTWPVLTGLSDGFHGGWVCQCHLTSDRCCVCPRRLAPMRLYSLSKRHFVLVFVVFFVCFGLTVFVGIKGQ